MINDIKFKKLYHKYGKDVYAVHWMWHMILTEATKQKGSFNQGEENPHDDISLISVFDLVAVTHGIDFIKGVIADIISKDYCLLEVDEDGLMSVKNWEKYQHHLLSNDRVKKHRDNAKLEPVVTEILEMFNKLTGKNLKVTTDAHRKHVRGRLADGFTVDDFKKVIIWKIQQWGDNPKMAMYIRPETLFIPGKFDQYLNEIPKNNPLTNLDVKAQNPNTPDQAVIAVTDLYGRRRVITKEQFDQAEEGYFRKD